MAKRGGRSDGTRHDRTDAESLATKERHGEWLKRRKQGWTYQAIADAETPKVTKQSVHGAIREYLRETIVEPANELRQLELERLDALLLELNKRIDTPIVTEGGADDKIRAIEAVLKVGDQRAKLLGLNAPKLVADVTPPREDMWERVREWLRDPTPELAAVLAETGWERKAS